MTTPARLWTVRDVLDWTRERFQRAGFPSARLDAEVLLAAVMKCQRIALYTGLEKPLSPPERDQLRELVRRRLEHEPIAYITGSREFWSLPIGVDRRVLIPRPETETLVEEALRWLPADRASRACDVGTGSGAIALALLSERPLLEMVGIDRSAEAVDVARANAAAVEGGALAGRLALRVGDLLAPLDAGERFDAIVSNPPYIASGEIDTLMRDVREYEPREALDGGVDGLDVVRRLLEAAPAHLGPNGVLIIEIGAGQSAAVTELAAGRDEYAPARAVKDHAGHERVMVVPLAGALAPVVEVPLAVDEPPGTESGGAGAGAGE